MYRHMDPHEVLIDVIGDIEDAKVRLSLAEAKTVRSGLTDRPGQQEIARFVGSALRYASVATDAAVQRRRLEKR